MAYQSTNPLFKSLDDKEEARFRKYAEENDPKGGIYNSHIHHPICCLVWQARGFKDKHAGTPPQPLPFPIKVKEPFLLQSAWSEKREGEQAFCFVIRTKEYACSGTNYVVHMMTDDGGFHHGHYTDDADDALSNFLTRCANKGVKSLPLVNEN